MLKIFKSSGKKTPNLILRNIKRSSSFKNIRPREYDSPGPLIEDFFKNGKKEESNFLLIRHAQSYGNLYNQLYGFKNYKLTPFGKEQSKWIKDYFKYTKDKSDTLNSSVLIRAMETANIALDLNLDLGVTQDSDEVFNEERIRLSGKSDLEVYNGIVKRDIRFNEFSFGPLEGSDIVDMTHEEHYALFRQ